MYALGRHTYKDPKMKTPNRLLTAKILGLFMLGLFSITFLHHQQEKKNAELTLSADVQKESSLIPVSIFDIFRISLK